MARGDDGARFEARGKDKDDDMWIGVKWTASYPGLLLLCSVSRSGVIDHPTVAKLAQH